MSIIPFFGFSRRVHLHHSGARTACSADSVGPSRTWLECGGRPILTQGIPCFCILNWPVNVAPEDTHPFVGMSLKLSLVWSSLIASILSCGNRNRLEPSMFEGVFDHFLS
jgi:hypothetical protein